MKTVLLITLSHSLVAANSNIDILFVHFVEKVSQQNNINIYIDEDLEDKTVSLFIPEKITNKNLMKLFKNTAYKMDYELIQNGNNYYLSKIKSPIEKSYIYKLKYNSNVDCRSVLDILKIKYKYLADSNVIIVTSTQPKFDEALSFLKKVDTKQKQVILKIMIYEYQDNFVDERGIQYATVYQNANDITTTALNSIIAPFNSSHNQVKSTTFWGALRFLHENNEINIKQYPYILAKNNKPFKFEAVENIPYLVNTTTTEASNTSQQSSIDYKDVGLKINGAVFIYDDYITLDLDLIVEDLTSTDNTQTPQSYKRHLNSNTNIKYNNVLVLSGIKRKKISKTNLEIPILAQIPFLGEAFKFKFRSEEDINITIAIEVLRTQEDLQNLKEIINELNL